LRSAALSPRRSCRPEDKALPASGVGDVAEGGELALGTAAKPTSLTQVDCRVPPQVANNAGCGRSMRITIPAVLSQVVLAAFVAWTSAQGAETESGISQRNLDAVVASFDCAHSASAREKAICGDRALSALDGKLGRLYRERAALLSPQGSKLLQESERSWLRFVGTVCSSDGPENKPWLSMRSCLTRQYNNRIRQIQQVGQIGPFFFNRVDLYAAEPAQDDYGSASGFYIQHAGYPQIDNANSPELRAWNQDNARRPEKDGDCGPGDYDTDYEVGYANARFISVEWKDSTYCHGTPHGFGGVKSNNTVLSPQLRALEPQDIFGSGENWASPLKEYFWAVLTQTGWHPPDNQPDIKRQVEGDFVQPDRWLFTKDGLQVAFDSYEGGCNACTPQPVTVPWSTLKPLLSGSSVVP